MPAIGIIRSTFFFQMDRYGWSESWYRDGTLTDIVPGDDYVDLAVARADLLGRDFATGPAGKGTPAITYIRNSDIGEFRDARIFVPPNGGIISSKSPGFGQCDMPWTALKTRFETTFPARRTIKLMRGLPDGFFVDGDDFTPTPAWKTLFSKYVTRVGPKLFGYAIPDQKGLMVVTAMTYDAAKKVVRLASATAVPALSLFVRITKCKSVPKINGRFKLQADPAGGGFFLYPFGCDPGVASWIGDGLFEFMSYKTQVVSSAMPTTPTQRKTGRPFDSPRGRSRRRALCRL